MATKTEKEKALEATIASLEKQFGKGTIMQMGKTPIEKIGAIPTGCMSIDEITGIGGIPRGRVTEVFGPEMSGKTTMCLHIIAQAQKLGGMAAFIDVEHALDLNYASNIGVNVTSLLISQPDYGEQALEVADALIRSNSVDIVVVDSVAALVPKSELEGEMGDSTIALQARLMSKALRKLTSNVNKSNTALIFINQLRSKIGIMFGNPECVDPYTTEVELEVPEDIYKIFFE
jgi:recombination protein RecA